MAQRPWQAVAGVVVAGLVISAGCTPPNPAAAPVPSATPSVSASAVPSSAAPDDAGPPEMPAAARGSGPRAAKAFVRHYIDLVNYAVAQGDTEAISRLGARSCASCSNVIERIEEVYESGGQIEGGGWTLIAVSTNGTTDPQRPIVDVGIRMKPQRVQVRRGARWRKFDGGRMPASFRLVRRSDHWVVEDWVRIP